MITLPGSKTGSKRTAKATVVPAPTYGMDVRHPLAQMPKGSSIYSYNLVPSSHGLGIRKGFKEYAVKIDSVQIAEELYSGVTTLVVFHGTNNATTTDDKLFAVTNVGIFDITDPSALPDLKLTFNVQSEGAGVGVSCGYIDEGGHEFVLYADERNGLFVYSNDTDTWDQATGISGDIVPEEIVFCVVHKLRLWFVKRNTADAYYMPVNSMIGTAEKFTFGSKFSHGGYLVGLYNWSVDGGSGVDDFLVAVSSTGDVLPYMGEDPSQTDTWSLKGSYFVGAIPWGRRIATQAGGKMHILSSYGLTSMNDLLNGVDTRDLSANSLSSRVAPLIRQHMIDTPYQKGWELIFAPTEGVYIINTPASKNNPQIQYVMDLNTSGWGVWRGVPMHCAEEMADKIYFGFGDKVYILDGFRDYAKKYIGDLDDYGLPIEFSVLTRFDSFGSPAANKMVQFIRPDFLSQFNPSYGVKAVYDYAIDEHTIPMSVVVDRINVSTWDSAIWDRDLWGDENRRGHARLIGSSGMGRVVAIAIRGETTEDIKLTSFDIIWKAGGVI